MNSKNKPNLQQKTKGCYFVCCRRGFCCPLVDIVQNGCSVLRQYQVAFIYFIIIFVIYYYLFIIILFVYFSVCMSMYVDTHVDARGTSCRSQFYHMGWGWDLNSGYEVWQRAPFPTEPSISLAPFRTLVFFFSLTSFPLCQADLKFSLYQKMTFAE